MMIRRGLIGRLRSFVWVRIREGEVYVDGFMWNEGIWEASGGGILILNV